ncbi:hypothetical protein KA107_03515 [Candidatus Pacearchaeota archaeon]|nr:hypothetical protein [Candidatus Pacearchaeota archaeon]
MEELKEFGLSENESKIYLSLLKAGIITANRLAEITGIKRSTTYDNLSTLMIKGIVSSLVKDQVHLYSAVEPSKILHIMEERKEKIKRIIPELNKLQNTIPNRGGVIYFEGKKGVLTILNDILDQKKELWFYGSRTMAKTTLEHYPDDFIEKRIEKKIFLRAVLAEEDSEHPAYKEKKVQKFSETRYLKSFNGIMANVFIYGDSVAFMSSGEIPAGVIIKNKEIIQQQRALFDILWNASK